MSNIKKEKKTPARLMQEALISYWADIYHDTFMTESIVDDDFIETATELLADIQDDYPENYSRALKYLELHRGHNLVVTPAQFAEKRISSAIENATNAASRAADEPAMSRDELIRSVGAKNKADMDASKQALKEKAIGKRINSIWIKDVILDQSNENNSVAIMEIEFADGKKIEDSFPIGTTGNNGGFEGADKLYKQVKRMMQSSSAARQYKITELDIRLSMIKSMYSSQPWIKWMFGKNKVSDQHWAFTKEADKISSSGPVKTIVKKLKPETYRNWRVTYSDDRGTKIYRREG